jgi:hypothetical protein
MSSAGNTEQRFTSLPPEPSGRNKNMGADDRIPPKPANSRHVHYYIFQRSLSELNTPTRSIKTYNKQTF